MNSMNRLAGDGSRSALLCIEAVQSIELCRLMCCRQCEEQLNILKNGMSLPACS